MPKLPYRKTLRALRLTRDGGYTVALECGHHVTTSARLPYHQCPECGLKELDKPDAAELADRELKRHQLILGIMFGAALGILVGILIHRFFIQ